MPEKKIAVTHMEDNFVSYDSSLYIILERYVLAI
jgi:hypothetical protein